MFGAMVTLKEGDKAPTFKGKDQDGNEISLKQFLGKRVILFFYPEDDTPTCTQEACNFRDNYADLKKQGYEVIGISPDGMESHKKFVNKFKLNYSLLADENKTVINAYGVWGPKKLYGREYDGIHRMIFVINEEGRIAKIVRKVLSKKAVQQALKP